MIYTWEDLLKKEGSRSLVETSIAKGKYKKISHGLYTDGDLFISEMEQLFARYPRATLTMQSAFEYYQLSNYIPDKYFIVTPYNAHRIDNDKVIQSYMDENLTKIGREKIDTEFGYVYIFDKERMLIELFRNKNKLPRDYFLEIVSSYRILKSMGVISFYKVSEYCKSFNNGTRILKEIQEVI